MKVDQDGRAKIDMAGDFGVRDQTIPWKIEYGEPTDLIAIELPGATWKACSGPPGSSPA